MYTIGGSYIVWIVTAIHKDLAKHRLTYHSSKKGCVPRNEAFQYDFTKQNDSRSLEYLMPLEIIDSEVA